MFGDLEKSCSAIFGEIVFGDLEKLCSAIWRNRVRLWRNRVWRFGVLGERIVDHHGVAYSPIPVSETYNG